MENKEHIATAKGENLGISRKFAVEVAVPFRKYHMDLGHKRGSIGPGRFPAKVAKEMLRLLNSAEKNALNKGLDLESLYVARVVANKGNTQMKPGRHRGRKAKRTHIEITLGEKKKTNKKE